MNNFNEAGLPNITGTYNQNWVEREGAQGSGAIISSTGNAFSGSNSGYRSSGGFLFNASHSNPLYGNSDMVQPPSSNKLLYYKVGNAIINENLIDAANILSDLNVLQSSKANVNLTNILPSEAFITQITEWCVPDYTAGVGVSTGNFVPPKNGIITLRSHGSDSCYMSVVVNGLTLLYVNNGSYFMGNNACSLPVSKGVTYSISGNNLVCYFFPMKGAC